MTTCVQVRALGELSHVVTDRMGPGSPGPMPATPLLTAGRTHLRCSGLSSAARPLGTIWLVER
eukprot:scaffold202201_cov37-Tisochrysis_lutea.AAC.1